MAIEQDPDWAPTACTLPTIQRPLRVAEFDNLFAAVQRSIRPEPTGLDLVLPSSAETKARELGDQESLCCSFFSFEFELTATQVVMHIRVPQAQIEVLDALEARLRGALKR